MATKANLVGGHEGTGVVVAVGNLVDDIKLGDHVGIQVREWPTILRMTLLMEFTSGLMAHVAIASSATKKINHFVPKHFCQGIM